MPTAHEAVSRGVTPSRTRWVPLLLWLASTLLGPSAHAAPPTADVLLAEFGLSPDQIAQVRSGKFVTVSQPSPSERGLVAAFAFFVQAPPSEIAKDARKGLLPRVDPGMLAYARIPGEPTPADFAKLTLLPDRPRAAQAYLTAKPGGGLNLSPAEIDAFRALGGGAAVPDVEAAVRTALLARLEAYRAQGLPGIAPYALASSTQRSPGDELRSATQASKTLQKYAPAVYQMLLDYPHAKAPGTEESFRWERFIANGEPTIALTHGLFVPEGDACVFVQRQFYVSTGYNTVQAVIAILPVEGGSVVLYTNHTSTDQVAGISGGAKRSIGSKLLASQLQDLYRKMRAAVQKPKS